MSEITRLPKHKFAIYTDEPEISMDHPLFMAKFQSRIWASLAAKADEPIAEALPEILKATRDIFGPDIPPAMVMTEVSLTYAELSRASEGAL